MLMSKLYSPTLRETPAEAELISHQLMLRAGLMRKSASGIYTYLPLGYRVLKKIMEIIREEMDAAGGQEILLPIVQPAELWHETGRWADYGDEMFRLSDRHQREFCLGPTHEEIITALVRSDVRSYRQLPLRLYQIQSKFRDEIRPRFGVMRSREFVMKDMYSFDQDEEGLQVSYEAMYSAYERIFERCGLTTRPVEADSGAIGGDTTHEFMVLAEAGEAEVVFCDECSYAANVERAESADPTDANGGVVAESLKQVEEVSTPGVTSIDELSKFLQLSSSQMIKTMIYLADGQPVAALVRGDHILNEVKLQKALGCQQLELAGPSTIEAVTGAPVGFAGPLGLNVPIVADRAVTHCLNAVTGANKKDYHLRNVNYGRDFSANQVADIRQVMAGESCPKCGAELKNARGIEVGQVFKLGTKYSVPLKASFLDENGQEKPLVMGCYGIGVSRTLAAVIEQHHDDNGIIWPVSIAPYHVVVVPVSSKDERQSTVAEKIYRELQSAGVEVVIDDRNERPGVKFKDADLIGFPIRITIGARALEEDAVEIFLRSTQKQYLVPINNVREEVACLLSR